MSIAPRAEHASPADLIADALGLVGYSAGVPRWISPEAETIDRGICEDSPCPICGWHGLEYRPFHRMPRSYRAVAFCPDCQHVAEF